MTASLHDTELLRARWRRYRKGFGLLQVEDKDFGRAGLAARAPSVTVRFLMLPADPESVEVRFDDDFWRWWRQIGVTPEDVYDRWSNQVHATAGAAIRADQMEHGWERYLAVHRHGGVEVADNVTYKHGEQVYMELCQIVRLIRVGLTLQQKLCERTSPPGPWEVVVALRDTAGLELADFASGWQDSYDVVGAEFRCFEPAVLIRRDVTDYPDTPEQRRDLVIDIADQVEQSWGA